MWCAANKGYSAEAPFFGRVTAARWLTTARSHRPRLSHASAHHSHSHSLAVSQTTTTKPTPTPTSTTTTTTTTTSAALPSTTSASASAVAAPTPNVNLRVNGSGVTALRPAPAPAHGQVWEDDDPHHTPRRILHLEIELPSKSSSFNHLFIFIIYFIVFFDYRFHIIQL